jgi:hypothetical protein
MGPKTKGGARGGPKPGTKQAKAAAERSAQNANTPQSESDGPKKPTVKEIIGGASWTGKLPVNMLSEHCQKQKWEKPEYIMVWTVLLKGRFRSVANGFFLKGQNPGRVCFSCHTEKGRSQDKRTD